MASTPTSSCDICRETYSESRNKKICAIRCGHVYHELCLKSWIRTQRSQNATTTCPICRKKTNMDEIYVLFGNVPTSSPANTLPSTLRADSRREICERSRLLNPSPEEISTPQRISIRSRLMNRLYMLCTHGSDGSCRKIYSTLVIKLILTLGLLMLMTFHDESKIFICEHYVIIIFAICFICGVVGCIVEEIEDEMVSVVGGGSILWLSAFTIGNLWGLEPCVTMMYPFKTLMLAIGLTTFIAIVLTMIAFKIWDLTEKREVLFWNLFLLIIIIILCSIVWYFYDRNLVVWYFLQSLCLFVCCLYLIMFTQLMKENTYNHPAQYIFFATGLYVSIVNILIFILKILGEAKIF